MRTMVFSIITACVIIFGGCRAKEPLIKTVYVDKLVPVSVVPEPPKIDPPEYEVSSLTPEQRQLIGIVARAYAIDLKQCMAYSSSLEQVVQVYFDLSKDNPFNTVLTPQLPGDNIFSVGQDEYSKFASSYEAAKAKLKEIAENAKKEKESEMGDK